MRKKVTTTLVLVAGLLGVAMPVLAALYLAHRQSMDAEVRLAMTMAEEVLRRADDVGDHLHLGAADTLGVSNSSSARLKSLDVSMATG